MRGLHPSRSISPIIDLWKILSPRQTFQNLQGTCSKYEPASSTEHEWSNNLQYKWSNKVTHGFLLRKPRCSCAVGWYRQRHVREHSSPWRVPVEKQQQEQHSVHLLFEHLVSSLACARQIQSEYSRLHSQLLYCDWLSCLACARVETHWSRL